MKNEKEKMIELIEIENDEIIKKLMVNETLELKDLYYLQGQLDILSKIKRRLV